MSKWYNWKAKVNIIAKKTSLEAVAGIESEPTLLPEFSPTRSVGIKGGTLETSLI